MSGTTLVLDGGGERGTQVFEVRLERFKTGARSATTPEEDSIMSIEEQAKGKLDEAKGRGKQAQGDLTGDNAKKAEGMLDEAKGKLRQGADKAREAVHDATDKH
ncbi:MAG: CsbD family protein [Gaiellales bacterium]